MAKKTSRKKSSGECEPCYPSEQSESITIRKIKNGFIMQKSTSGPKGYKSEETYHKTKPKITT